MTSGGFGRSYPKEWLALEARLRDAVPLITALANGVPYARERLAAAMEQAAEACVRAKAEAATLRAKRPASPTGPPGAAARKEPRTAPPGGDPAARAAFEEELSTFLNSDAGRAAVAAVEDAASELRNPTICGVVFPLHDLFVRVKEHGGYDTVSRKKMWAKSIAASFGDFTETNIGSKVKAAYRKYLLAYENGARAPAPQGGARRDAPPPLSPRLAAAAAAMARAAGQGGGASAAPQPEPQAPPLRPMPQSTAGKATKPAARQGMLFGGAKHAGCPVVKCNNVACGIMITLMPSAKRFVCSACQTQQDVAIEID